MLTPQATELITRVIQGEPLLAGVDRIEHLPKGFSPDLKFVLWKGTQPHYLLRLVSVSNLQRARAEFEIIGRQHGRGIRCPRPVLFGVIDSGTFCYMVVEYLAGEGADDALPRLPPHQQYEIGIEAGSELRKLHGLSHADPHFDWGTRRTAKYRRKVAEAAQAGLSFSGQTAIERYIEARLDLLQQQPVRFQHDDFHPGNLIIRGDAFGGVIDFNRFDWGDPVEDFYKVPWFTTKISLPFSIGQFHGYFAEGVPDRFWERYTLMVALNLHGSLTYAARSQGMEWWPMHMSEIIETHDFQGGGPPSWYKQRF